MKNTALVAILSIFVFADHYLHSFCDIAHQGNLNVYLYQQNCSVFLIFLVLKAIFVISAIKS